MFHAEKELGYVGAKNDMWKKVITEFEEISEILYQYHSNPMGGHSGINNTLATISQFYTWKGMKEDVVEYVGVMMQFVYNLYSGIHFVNKPKYVSFLV